MSARGKRTGKPFVAVLLGCAIAALVLSPAYGQYFGGNKMRYETFEFQVLRSEHFDIHYYEEQEEAVRIAAVLAERWHRRLSGIFGRPLSDRQPLILYAGHPHFRQTNATPGEVGEGTGGFTEIFKRRIVMPFAGPPGETDHVLGHELVHAFQFDLLGESTHRPEAAMRLPLWFIEGMAEHLSLGPADPHTAMWMRDAVLHDDLPGIRHLHRPHYFPYRYGHAFWSYVTGRWGDEVVEQLLLKAGREGSARRALRLVLDTDNEELSRAWHDALRETFLPLVEAAQPPDEYGRPLVEGDRRGRFNISPSLSPDGRTLAFFSERDRFSIELYLLDVESGEIIRRLTRAVIDPHFDSLQFLNSAGAWHPEGEHFAFAGVSMGRPMLTVLDAATGDTVTEHRFPELVEILHPTWSPDGEQIAFAANTGGFTDLYLLDMSSGELRRLTDDLFTAIQPAWSPDGKTIAFVTDRFTSDRMRLQFGDYRLAVLDLHNDIIRPLPSLAGGKNINPQWHPDGSALYFLSDAEGTTNLYRASENGNIVALTDLQTGISGISRLGPALSVAGHTPGRIVATVFEHGKYHLYLLDRAFEERPVPAEPVPPRPEPGMLPPAERQRSLVTALLKDPGPPPETVLLQEPRAYRPRLSLDHVTQPMVGVGVGSEGAAVGGAVGIFWSDMLGDHNVMTLLQAEGEIDTLHRDIAALVSYENRRRRWGWGGTAGQIPFRSTRLQVSREARDGESLLIGRTIREWQINRELTGRITYPFNRAQRVELFGGMRHINIVGDERIETFSIDELRFVSDETRTLPRDSLNLATTGAALVHDTSVFGSTAPALGQRHRLELSAAHGDLDFHTTLVDMRRYFLLHPRLTLAGRLLHFGRYGNDAEDPRLGSMYLGRPSLIRGYTAGSLRLEECESPDAETGACPVFDQLFGSRLAIGNVELRTPLLGPRGFAPSPIRAPLDGVMFYDVGVAWTRDQQASFLDGPRSPVSSYGLGLRIGVLGILVLQWNYVYPQDRPEQGWHWEFTIMPGF